MRFRSELSLVVVVSLSVLALARCGNVGEADLLDDSFLQDGGKADLIEQGVLAGDAEVCGILRLASQASREELDHQVRLDSRAARNIVDYRDGPDGLAGTKDDQAFDSLPELDAVKYVGPRAFGKMISYTRENALQCQTLDIQILGLSDWHGQLDPVAVYGVGNIGGAATLSAYFQLERRANPYTLTVSAGDSYGASPPIGSFFEERSVVEAMNQLGIDAEVPGNHNFDRGVAHLETMIEASQYTSVAANLQNVSANMTCLSKPEGSCILPYEIFMLGGVKVAVIGLATDETPDLVANGNLGTMQVSDPVAAALNARAAAALEGAQVFIAITHIGANPGPEGQITGALAEFAGAVNGFDFILGGHTHSLINTDVNGVPVVENDSQGLTYSRVSLTYDFQLRTVSDHLSEIVTPDPTAVEPDADMEQLLSPYRVELAAALDGPIAQATGMFARGDNVERLGEVPIGNLIADAIRIHYDTQIGFVNGGGIRASLPSSYAPADISLRRPGEGYSEGPPWDLVVGDVYTVLPFGNTVVTRTVTGAQLWEMAEHSVEALPAPKGWFGQISGFQLVFDSSRESGSRVVSLTLDDGASILPDDTTYSMATSDFISAGGDGYSMLAGEEGTYRDKLAEVVLIHISSLDNLDPLILGRTVDLATP